MGVHFLVSQLGEINTSIYTTDPNRILVFLNCFLFFLLLVWSQLGQLGFAYNFSDIQVEENGGSTTRVFSTSE